MANLKVTKKVNLQTSHHKEKQFGKMIYCDLFTNYINVESLCCTCETNIMYVNYTSILKISCRCVFLKVLL